MHRIGEVEDIDDGMEAKLVALDIRTTDDFLARAATPAGRSELAASVGTTDRELLKWANCADLMRIDGVGMQFADLLEEAGVDTIPELAQRNAANLHARVVEVNTAGTFTGRMPTAQEVEAWIAQAKALPRILVYAGDAATRADDADPLVAPAAAGDARADVPATPVTPASSSATTRAPDAPSSLASPPPTSPKPASWLDRLLGRLKGSR